MFYHHHLHHNKKKKKKILILSCLSSPIVRYVAFPCENVGSTPLADNFLRKVANRAAELPGGGRRNFFIKFLYNLL
ncbi:hypothetical protein PFMALIP_03960 [Plasmodium falciparum MaliPS096_E11]|uniref:Uncharacterized protein n=1 Tax=Plasmodium falciparum MaliPS096_E11 TaxID=1036727 RepID=A0A024WML5_PLAFA|nr:hypothetical protein PFMALIP_03960 [Plasmodium falciparum MaliPS096_E11]